METIDKTEVGPTQQQVGANSVISYQCSASAARVKCKLEELRDTVPFKKATVQILREGRRSVLIASGYDASAFDRELLQPVSHDPLIADIVERRKPLILSDTSHHSSWVPSSATQDVKSWIGVPLIYAEEIVGLLTLDHERPGHYQDSMADFVIKFAEQISPFVWQARTQDGAERLARDMQIFHEVLQAISAKLDIKDLLGTIVAQVARRLHCSHCTIFLAQKQENRQLLLIPKVTEGQLKDPMTRFFRPGEGFAGWVFEHGRSLVVPDVWSDHRFSPERVRRGGARSMLVSPVRVGSRTIGVISCDQNALDWFSANDRDLVDALATQAGIAIQRSAALNLLHDISSRIIRSELNVGDILREVVSGAIELTNTSTGVIYLVSNDGSSVVDRFQPDDFVHPDPRMDNPNGLTRTAIRTGEIRIVGNTNDGTDIPSLLRSEFQSIIVVPAKLHDKVIGVLFLDDRASHEFTEIEKACLQTLVSDAAIAIQNARLRDNLKLELNSHRSFDKILRQLSVEEPEQERTLSCIAEGVLEILGDQVSPTISLYNQEEETFGAHLSYGPLAELLSFSQRADGTGFHVVRTGKSLYLPDATTSLPGNPPVRREVLGLGVTSFAAIPLKRHDTVVGVLFINSQKRLVFDEETIKIIELFASHAGLAIEIARFHASSQVLGPEHVETLASMNNLALTMHAQGDLAGARQLEEEGLATRRRVLGSEHPDTCTSVLSLARTLAAQGDLAGARKLEEETLDICRRTFGPEHSYTLVAMANLGSTLLAQGNEAEARKLHEETLETHRRILGLEHPYTLVSMGKLANTLFAQGDSEGARKLCEETLEICRTTLGPEHHDTLTLMSNLGGMLRAEGELEDARGLQEETLAIQRRVLGPEHHDTLTSMNNLGLTLRAQGELAKARKLQEETLPIQRRMLGADHPSTLASMNNLAGALHAQGDLRGSCTLLQEVLNRSRRVLGFRHQSTSKSAWNLWSTLRVLGEREAAQAVSQSNLLWLLECDPATLSADQREIREMVAREVEGSG